MKVQKIHIIGGPGSGKTYLGDKISDLVDVECLHLDKIYWEEALKCLII